MPLTNQNIKKFSYSKTPNEKSKSGQISYPKDIHWDGAIPGFGVRVFPSGKKSFVFQYRTAQGIKRLADIGPFGAITVEEARQIAKRWSAQVIDGHDPLEEKRKERAGELMADLCSAYIERHAKPFKKSWKEDERRVRLYISPSLGAKQVKQLRRQDIAKLHDEIGRTQSKPYMANRVKEQLGKMFELASTWGFVDPGFINPARGIDDFPERERGDYIKPEHLGIVKKAIDQETNPVGKAVIWLYLLTGKRRNELLEAKWSDFDEKAKTLTISDTKNSDDEILVLGDEALKVIEQAKKFRVVGNPYIFPGDGGRGHLVNIQKIWERIRIAAAKKGAEGVDRVTIHGLRHTFAVYAVSYGGSDLGTVRALLHQKSLRVTTVYAKYLQEAKRKAFNAQGSLMTELLKEKKTAKPSKLKAKSGRK